MQNKFLFIALASAALLWGGCDKQTKINSEKIDALSQKLAMLQQLQSNQLAEIQSQLKSLTPTFDKMSGSYFEKSYADAFFFHTNTLYLLLLVDQKIEAELKAAAAKREVEQALVYSYHTNSLDTINLNSAQIKDTLISQTGQLETNLNVETKSLVTALGDELAKQIKLAAPDAAEIVRWHQMAADVAKIQVDLDLIKAKLESTNRPAIQP